MTTVLFADTPEAANPDHDIEASILGPNVDIVRYV